MSFAIFKTNEQGFDKLVLKDSVSNTSVEIIPDCGAILHSFNILHEGQMLNIIDHYDSRSDFSENVTSKGFKSCKLSPFACRLKNSTYSFDSGTYTVHKFFLGKNGHHGLLYDCEFTVTDQGTSESMAFATMKYEYRVFDKGFPFNYDCIVTYTLEQNNKLTISTRIVNRGTGSMPIQDGWHPYFTFGRKVDGLLLEFQTKAKVEFDEELLPTGNLLKYDQFLLPVEIGEINFDDCFLLNFTEGRPLCILRDPVKNIQLEIQPDLSYPYLQIYIPSHRNSIAIENLSAAPDAFNNGMGLVTLGPGASSLFKTTYKITPLTYY